jgi:hypothetical protein
MLITSSFRRASISLGVVALAIAGTARVHGQQSSARNVFWSASDLVQVSENPGAKPVVDRSLPTPAKKPSTTTTHTRPHVEPELVAKNGYGEQPQLVRVSDEQIGIRYALLLRDTDGHYNEVSPTAVFHNGDRLRLSLMANQPGYLYVIQKGSSGAWNSIYPGKHADGTEPTNHLNPGTVYQIPGKGSFRFDQTPGQEKLFLVLSRERIADLEGAINSLKQGGQPSAAPPNPKPPADQGEMVEALNTIPDAFVQRLASRDLTIEEEETVDQPQSGNPSGEKAVYVVSKVSYTRNESPRVVASVTLRHE